MTPPVSPRNEPSRMKKITSGKVDESIYSRLPHHSKSAYARTPSSEAVYTEPVAPPSEADPEPRRRRWQFLPAFWTIASVMSLGLNIVLIVVVLIALQMIGQLQGLQQYATTQASGLLGGLYTNFVKMDEANIRTNIHIEEQIPVEFTLRVSGPTNVTTTEPVTIRGATVWVSTGGLTIRDANATIVLPAGVMLPINIEELVVPVDQDVPAILDVPVDIPLDQTELHEPFVGLQKVVEPWYCFINPAATVNGLQVCSQTTSPAPAVEPTFEPTPVGTVIP